jgi:hypothetical protein
MRRSRMSKRLLLALSIVACAPAHSAPKSPQKSPQQSWDDETNRASVIFTGKLVEVGRPPGFLSGCCMAIQTLTYEVTKVDKGNAGARESVRYLILGGVPYLDDKSGLQVSPRLTKLGASYVVLEQQYDGLFAIDAKPTT